jgi:hypothetical protein
VAIVAVCVALSACGSSVPESPVVSGAPPSGTPSDLAPADVVLRAYLEAVRAGDCAAASRFVIAATFRTGTGELCGAVTLSDYRTNGNPIRPSPTEVLFGMTLTTGGSTDRSIPAGDFLWTYDLVRQPNGAWRIVGAGQG